MQNAPGFEHVFIELAGRIEALLADMPVSTLEARRLITRELHFEPRAEELQTIVRVAHDESPHGPRRDIPRRLLCVRVLADMELKQLNEGRPLEPRWIDRVSGTLPAIRRTVREIEDELRTLVATEALSPGDRDYLLQAGDALVCPRDEIIAGSVLAGQLARLTHAVHEGNLVEIAPSLTEREQQLIRCAVLGDEQPANAPSRPCIDAIALRTLLERLMSDWQALPQWPESDDAQKAERQALLERLQQARVALDAVAARLQQQQDMALMANLDDFAEEIRRTGRGLFSLKLKLAHILRDPLGSGARETENPIVETEALRELLRECVREEIPVGDQTRRLTREEIYLDALKKERDAAPEPEQPDMGMDHRRKERRRMKWMIGTAAALGCISLVVNILLLPPSADHPEKPSLRKFDTVMDVSRVQTAGPMMFTHVDGWHELDKDTQRSRVERLGQTVEADGFRMVFVLDEYGQPAAYWGSEQGISLIDTPPPANAP